MTRRRVLHLEPTAALAARRHGPSHIPPVPLQTPKNTPNMGGGSVSSSSIEDKIVLTPSDSSSDNNNNMAVYDVVSNLKTVTRLNSREECQRALQAYIAQAALVGPSCILDILHIQGVDLDYFLEYLRTGTYHIEYRGSDDHDDELVAVAKTHVRIYAFAQAKQLGHLAKLAIEHLDELHLCQLNFCCFIEFARSSYHMLTDRPYNLNDEKDVFFTAYCFKVIKHLVEEDPELLYSQTVDVAVRAGGIVAALLFRCLLAIEAEKELVDEEDTNNDEGNGTRDHDKDADYTFPWKTVCPYDGQCMCLDFKHEPWAFRRDRDRRCNIKNLRDLRLRWAEESHHTNSKVLLQQQQQSKAVQACNYILSTSDHEESSTTCQDQEGSLLLSSSLESHLESDISNEQSPSPPPPSSRRGSEADDEGSQPMPPRSKVEESPHALRRDSLIESDWLRMLFEHKDKNLAANRRVTSSSSTTLQCITTTLHSHDNEDDSNKEVIDLQQQTAAIKERESPTAFVSPSSSSSPPPLINSPRSSNGDTPPRTGKIHYAVAGSGVDTFPGNGWDVFGDAEMIKRRRRSTLVRGEQE